MGIRNWGLDCCEVSAGFQSSVKDFQVGRYFISDRRTGDPPPTPPKGGEIEAYPFISDRKTKGHDTPPAPPQGRGA